jgi:hypothetical protein
MIYYFLSFFSILCTISSGVIGTITFQTYSQPWIGRREPNTRTHEKLRINKICIIRYVLQNMNMKDRLRRDMVSWPDHQPTNSLCMPKTDSLLKE